jgi:hypothetical protein
VQKLVNDIGEINLAFNMLKGHRNLWARRLEERDVSAFLDWIAKIETDISITLNDFIINNKNGKRYETHIMEEMRETFSCLNDLFLDIRNVRNDLDSSFIRREELENLEVDLGRFMKKMRTVLNYLEYEIPENTHSNN